MHTPRTFISRLQATSSASATPSFGSQLMNKLCKRNITPDGEGESSGLDRQREAEMTNKIVAGIRRDKSRRGSATAEPLALVGTEVGIQMIQRMREESVDGRAPSNQTAAILSTSTVSDDPATAKLSPPLCLSGEDAQVRDSNLTDCCCFCSFRDQLFPNQIAINT